MVTALTAPCRHPKTAARALTALLAALLGSTSAPIIAQTLPDASASAESTTATIQDTTTQASAFLTADDPARAQAVLQPLYDRGDANSQTLFLLALATKAQGDWPAAKRYLEELLAREPAAAGRVGNPPFLALSKSRHYAVIASRCLRVNPPSTLCGRS